MTDLSAVAEDVKKLLGHVAEIKTDIKNITARLDRIESNAVPKELCEAYRKDDFTPRVRNTTSIIAVSISAISFVFVMFKTFL